MVTAGAAGLGHTRRFPATVGALPYSATSLRRRRRPGGSTSPRRCRARCCSPAGAMCGSAPASERSTWRQSCAGASSARAGAGSGWRAGAAGALCCRCARRRCCGLALRCAAVCGAAGCSGTAGAGSASPGASCAAGAARAPAISAKRARLRSSASGSSVGQDGQAWFLIRWTRAPAFDLLTGGQVGAERNGVCLDVIGGERCDQGAGGCW